MYSTYRIYKHKLFRHDQRSPNTVEELRLRQIYRRSTIQVTEAILSEFFLAKGFPQ